MYRSIVVVSLAFSLLAACGGDDGGGDNLPGDDNLGGTVVNDTGPIAGATVSVLGANPAVEATTDADGKFSLLVPEGESDFLIEAAGHWGEVVRGNVDPGEKISGVEVELTTDAEVTEVATALSRTIAESNGIVVANFVSDGTDLASAKVDLLDNNAPVASDAPFSFDSNGDPTETPSILGGTAAELIFTNVAAGAYELFPDNSGSLGCATEYDTLATPLPVRAKTISSLTIFCAASQ
jgi:hypothetical protein